MKKFNKHILHIKRVIHPFTRTLLKAAVIFKLKVKYCDENEFNVITSNGPVIFSINHSNRHDFPCVSNILKKHFVILSDVGIRGSLGGLICDLNGAIYVKRDDRNSRLESKMKMVETLQAGFNLLIFPEGTWNLSDSLPMLPFPWGIIDIAKQTNTPIIPVIMEYDYSKKLCNATVGKVLRISDEESLQSGCTRLRDSMATLRWYLWEEKEMSKRAEINKDDFRKFITMVKNEYQRLDQEDEEKFIFNPYEH